MSREDLKLFWGKAPSRNRLKKPLTPKNVRLKVEGLPITNPKPSELTLKPLGA